MTASIWAADAFGPSWTTSPLDGGGGGVGVRVGVGVGLGVGSAGGSCPGVGAAVGTAVGSGVGAAVAGAAGVGAAVDEAASVGAAVSLAVPVGSANAIAPSLLGEFAVPGAFSLTAADGTPYSVKEAIRIVAETRAVARVTPPRRGSRSLTPQPHDGVAASWSPAGWKRSAMRPRVTHLGGRASIPPGYGIPSSLGPAPTNDLRAFVAGKRRCVAAPLYCPSPRWRLPDRSGWLRSVVKATYPSGPRERRATPLFSGSNPLVASTTTARRVAPVRRGSAGRRHKTRSMCCVKNASTRSTSRSREGRVGRQVHDLAACSLGVRGTARHVAPNARDDRRPGGRARRTSRRDRPRRVRRRGLNRWLVGHPDRVPQERVLGLGRFRGGRPSLGDEAVGVSMGDPAPPFDLGRQAGRDGPTQAAPGYRRVRPGSRRAWSCPPARAWLDEPGTMPQSSECPVRRPAAAKQAPAPDVLAAEHERPERARHATADGWRGCLLDRARADPPRRLHGRPRSRPSPSRSACSTASRRSSTALSRRSACRGSVPRARACSRR